MKKIATMAFTTLLAFSAALPATTAPADARNRGAKIAAGVLVGAAALAIIANSDRANASRSRRASWQRNCDRLYDRCQNGSDYACEKFETNGCSE